MQIKFLDEARKDIMSIEEDNAFALVLKDSHHIVLNDKVYKYQYTDFLYQDNVKKLYMVLKLVQ